MSGVKQKVHSLLCKSSLDEIQSDQFTQLLPKGTIIQTGTAFDFTDMEFFYRSTKKEPKYLRLRRDIHQEVGDYNRVNEVLLFFVTHAMRYALCALLFSN